MVHVPVKFKRMAAAFDEVARVRSCDSSGSEHSAADLSDLVNSFLERDMITEERKSDDHVDDQDVNENENNIDDDGDGDSHHQSNSQDYEVQESLRKLFDVDQEDVVKRSVRAEVEKALLEVTGDRNSSSPDFKRRLMTWLRSRGFDAGLCKSKWEKNGRNPSGNYEYIDVNASGTRYIIEVNLAGQFTIARPTSCYASLLDVFPSIFVGKPDELKQVARLICSAMRKSMKHVRLSVPPWRRPAYMHAKWFGAYKRTTNEVSSMEVRGRGLAGDRLVGFAPAPGVSLYCREEFGTRGGGTTGNLAAALNQHKEMLL